MKMILQKIRAQNVYVKTLVSFALVLCIVSAVVFPFLIRSEGLLRAQHAKATLYSMKEYVSGLEREYQMVSAQALNLFSDEGLFGLSQRGRIEYKWDVIQSIREIKRKISQIAECSLYVDEIMVFLPRQNRYISTGLYYEPMEKALYTALLKENESGQKRFLGLDGRIYTCYVRYSRHGSEKENDFIIASRWNTALIQHTMNELIAPDARASFVGSPFGGLSVSPPDDWLEEYRYGAIHVPSGDAVIGEGAGRLHCFWIVSDELQSTLVLYQAEDTVFPWRGIVLRQNAVIVATILLCALLFFVMMRQVISVPLRTLRRSIRENEQRLGLKSGGLRGDDFDRLLASYQNLISETMLLREENLKQQLLVKNAQLKQLQSQINPHFLFNSLLSAGSLINAGDDEEAAEMLSHLSRYYNYLTREALDEQTLMEEHRHMLDYVHVQLVRFGSRIRSTIEKPPEAYESLPIPRLTLQPIVENCFTHALNQVSAEGELRVSYEARKDALLILIENSGSIDDATLEALRGQPESVSGAEVSGLTNVHLRLRYRFGPAAGLRFDRGRMNGLKVTVVIPLRGDS